MNFNQDRVAGTRNNVFRSFDDFNGRIDKLITSYTALRLDIDVYGTPRTERLFDDFNGKVVKFLRDWEERRL
jgi:hypothetical protein